MSRWRARALAASVLFAALAACGDPAPEQPTSPSSVSAPVAKPKAESLPGNMVAAVAAGKNSTAISIHFALASPPMVATPLPVQIAIVPHQPFTTVRVHFECHDGLTMPMGEDFGPVSDVTPDKPLSHQLMLLPASEGMFMVTATVETLEEGVSIVRIFSIPVIVGPAQPAVTPAPQ